MLRHQKTLRFTVQDCFVTAHCLSEPAARNFHCEKAVSLPRVPVRPQAALVRLIVSNPLRIDDRGLRRPFVNGATALEIDANFKTLRVETARPIQHAQALKVVPFNADTLARKASKEGTPFSLDPSPNWLLMKLIPFQHNRYILRVGLNNKRKNVVLAFFGSGS